MNEYDIQNGNTLPKWIHNVLKSVKKVEYRSKGKKYNSQNWWKICTCHNSSAVVACGKLWPVLIIYLLNNTNMNVSKILIMSP